MEHPRRCVSGSGKARLFQTRAPLEERRSTPEGFLDGLTIFYAQTQKAKCNLF